MKLLGLGDNVIDYYTNLGTMYPGGNALNVAVHAAILGADSAYLGNLADDSMSNIIQDVLNQFHVDTSGCHRLPNTITKCCQYTVTDGERHYTGMTAGDLWSGPLYLTDSDIEYMKDFDIIHSSCNAKMENEIFRLKQLPALFTYDFGEKDKYRNADYYNKICHGLDLAQFSCPFMSDEEIRTFCAPLHERNVEIVLITMGSCGQCVSNGSSLIHGNAEYIEPIDTMGAGDSFLTAFVLSLYNQGWRKNGSISETAAANALQEATSYSTANCMKKGSFGYEASV